MSTAKYDPESLASTMLADKKFFGYTQLGGNNWYVTDWFGNRVGTILFRTIRTGRHNMAGTQTHFSFIGPNDTTWHGVQYGNDRYDKQQGLIDGWYCRCELMRGKVK